MSRLIKIGIYGTYLLFVITAVIKLIQLNAQNFAIQLRDINHIIAGFFFLVMGIIALIMGIKLHFRLQKNYTLVASALIYFFLVSAGGGFLQGIFGIIEFQVREIQVIWTDSAYFFIASATFAMAIFIAEVFKKGVEIKANRNFIIFVGIVVSASLLSLTKKMLFDASDLELYIPLLLVFIITLYLYFTLSMKSLYLKKRAETAIEQKAFLFISISGYCLMFGFIGVLLFSFASIELLRFLNSILFSVGYVLLYLGFTLPANQKT